MGSFKDGLYRQPAQHCTEGPCPYQSYQSMASTWYKRRRRITNVVNKLRRTWCTQLRKRRTHSIVHRFINAITIMYKIQASRVL